MTGLALLLAAGVLCAAGVDTLGWTDRDRQALGPSSRLIVNDTARGLHVAWKDGLGDVRYNFRPRSGEWRWPGGIVANSYPRNLGGLDVDLVTGQALFGTDRVTRGSIRGSFFRDSAAAAGRFLEYDLGPGYRRVAAATARYGWARFAAVRNDTVSYLSAFSSRRLERCGPFPTHSIAGGRASSRFCYLWTQTDGPDQGALMLKETPNNGQNWYLTINLSETSGLTENRAPFGAQAIYDSIRRYVVTAFHDGRRPNRSRLWILDSHDPDNWHPVHACSIPDTCRIGDYALAAGRPTVGRNPRTGELFVVWEQFDPANVEPLTGLCRADIWATRSRDNGRSWGPAVRLTGPDSASRRFPFVADVVEDSLYILCFADRCAGFWEQGQGPQTTNPVLLISVAVSELSAAVEHPSPPTPARAGPRVTPTVSRRGFDLSGAGGLFIRAFDPAGRLRAEERVAGPVCDWGHWLPPGVWLLELLPGSAATNQTVERVRVVRLP